MSAVRITARRRSIGFSSDEDGGEGQSISKRSKQQEQTEPSDLPDDFLEPLGPGVVISFPPELFPSAFNNKQFWKAGTFSATTDFDDNDAFATEGMDRVRVHPKFLHSNATSHKWVFGAIAELLDNAIDEWNNGATMVNIDVLRNPRTGEPMLLIEDNGGGMNPECIRHCMSFGYSAKSTQANTIGQYGNGFKTSTMRLGADVVVFTRNTPRHGGAPTQSIGLLSYTFLTKTGQDDILVPIVDYEIEAFGLRKIIRGSVQQWEESMETLKWWSPYSEEAQLLDQFKGMSHQGTKVIIYNLWEDQEGHLELDFRASRHDIQVYGANRDENSIELAERYPSCRYYYTYRYSLRTYMSILYIHLPSKFRMFLRGKQVGHHNMTDDLLCIETVTYKPKSDQTAKDCGQMTAVVTLGFVKDGKEHLDVQGFNVYHKNRLIKPFWRVWNSAATRGRGIVGFLEANFVEPAHDKQGFEKTVVLSRLQNRLQEIMRVFWHKNCHKIGYVNKHALRDNSTPAEDTHLQNDNHCLERNFLMQATTSAGDPTTEASLANITKLDDPSLREVCGNLEVIELANSDEEGVMPETQGQKHSIPDLLFGRNAFSEVKIETDVHTSEASASTSCKLIEDEAMPLLMPLSISCNSSILHLDEGCTVSLPSFTEKPVESPALCFSGKSLSNKRLLPPSNGVAHLAVESLKVNSFAFVYQTAKSNNFAEQEPIVMSSFDPQKEIRKNDTLCSSVAEVPQTVMVSPTVVATQESCVTFPVSKLASDSPSECPNTQCSALTQVSERGMASPSECASEAMQHMLSIVKPKLPREQVMDSHRPEDATSGSPVTHEVVEMEQTDLGEMGRTQAEVEKRSVVTHEVVEMKQTDLGEMGRTWAEDEIKNVDLGELTPVKCVMDCRMQEDVGNKPAEDFCLWKGQANVNERQDRQADPSSRMQEDVGNEPAEIVYPKKGPTCHGERQDNSSSSAQDLGLVKVLGSDTSEKDSLACMPELGLVKIPIPVTDDNQSMQQLACCPHAMKQKAEYLRRTIKVVLKQSEELRKQLQLQQDCYDTEVKDLERELHRAFSCIDQLKLNMLL